MEADMLNSFGARVATLVAAGALGLCSLTGTAAAQVDEPLCIGPFEPTTDLGGRIPEICAWVYVSEAPTADDPHAAGVGITGLASVTTHFVPGSEDTLADNGACVSITGIPRPRTVCTPEELP